MTRVARALKVYVAVTAAVYLLIPTLDRWHLPVTDDPQDRVERARTLMSYDDYEDHNAAIADAEAWETEQDYQHELDIAFALKEREDNEAEQAGREQNPDTIPGGP